MRQVRNGIMAAFAVAVLAVTPVYAGGVSGVGQPSADWNANWGFDGANEKQFNLNRALVIKQAEDGGFGTTYNDYSSSSAVTNCNIADSCSTYIEQQNNATAIGTSIYVEGDGNVVDGSNTGQVNAGNAIANDGDATGVDNSGTSGKEGGYHDNR